MSSYIKISYPTSDVNYALKECIMYIGKKYGKNNKDYLKSGIAYLGKKVKGASNRAIRFMIFSKKINGSESKQWCFKKNSYRKVYRYIIYRLLKEDKEGREKALNLLQNLYLQEKSIDSMINKKFSDILVLQQKEALIYAVDKLQFRNDKEVIEKILQCYNKCDVMYDSIWDRRRCDGKI